MKLSAQIDSVINEESLTRDMFVNLTDDIIHYLIYLFYVQKTVKTRNLLYIGLDNLKRQMISDSQSHETINVFIGTEKRIGQEKNFKIIEQYLKKNSSIYCSLTNPPSAGELEKLISDHNYRKLSYDFKSGVYCDFAGTLGLYSWDVDDHYINPFVLKFLKKFERDAKEVTIFTGGNIQMTEECLESNNIKYPVTGKMPGIYEIVIDDRDEKINKEDYGIVAYSEYHHVNYGDNLRTSFEYFLEDG